MNGLYLELKEYTEAIPTNENISDKTKVEYLKEYTRMYVNNKTPCEQATRKSSYYKYRASWIYANIFLAKLKIEEIENEKDVFIRGSLIVGLNRIVERIKKYHPKDTNGVTSVIFKKDAIQKSFSKKGQIVTLKKTWSTQMFDHMLAVDSKYLEALCIMFISGVRPVELQAGVRVINCDDSLKIIINGKKTHNGQYGQETREFTVSINDPHFFYLKKKIGNELFIKIDSAKLLGEQIRRNSKIVLSDQKTYISPYTYRHNFSRLLKNSKLSHDDIASALGHCTDKSQNYYSHASNRDNTDFRISDIKATKKIKRVVNNNYIKTTASIAPLM